MVSSLAQVTATTPGGVRRVTFFDDGDRVRILSTPYTDSQGCAGAVGTIVGCRHRRHDGAFFHSDTEIWYDVLIEKYTNHEECTTDHETCTTVCWQTLSFRGKNLRSLSPLEKLAECAE